MEGGTDGLTITHTLSIIHTMREGGQDGGREGGRQGESRSPTHYEYYTGNEGGREEWREGGR